jgi:hypothetical protein
MGHRNSRSSSLLVGSTCTVASAFVFASILMHGSNPQASSSWHSHHVASEPMPTWMAIGVGCIFGMVGLGSLIPAAFNLKVPRRVGNAVAMLIMTCFLGFFDFICIRCLVVGDQFISIPFVPNGVNTVLSWMIWGIFIVFLSGFAIACFVRIFTTPQRSVEA